MCTWSKNPPIVNVALASGCANNISLTMLYNSVLNQMCYHLIQEFIFSLQDCNFTQAYLNKNI